MWEHGPEAMEKELPGWAISALVRLAQVYISQSIGILSEHLG